MSALPWMALADGLMLVVRLTPKGGRDAIDGVEALADGRTVLRVRVKAAPSDGEANAALTRLLAGALGVAPTRVELVSGATARIKRVKVGGDAEQLAAALMRVRSGAARDRFRNPVGVEG